MMATMETRAEAMPAIDIIVESALWRDTPDAEAAVRRVVAAAATALSMADVELAIVLTDDAAIRALNREWRGIDKPTNVLSFAARPDGAVPAHATQDGTPALLGDIVIAYETAAREAAAEDKPFHHHLAHLAVHGFLHLLGFDHQGDDAAEDMEKIESEILATLGVADPYAKRDAET
jgi:probable rRNA maturation factor